MISILILNATKHVVVKLKQQARKIFLAERFEGFLDDATPVKQNNKMSRVINEYQSPGGNDALSLVIART